MTSPSSSSKSSPTGATGKNSAVALTAGGNNIELGKYRILRLLGQGGFGITYLAQDMATGQEVVIKESMPTDFAHRDSRTLQVVPMSNEAEPDCRWAMESFLNEARLLMQLDHPNIVKVQDAFPALGTAYYVMPWVGGNELGQAAPDPGEITEAWLAPILRQLLEALQYLHSKNILHRDIKPSNILMSESGAPVFIDFGAARAIISEKSATKVGSPGYTPIEQVQSKGKRGPWTDIYALGATCYRLITGHRPPQCEDRMGKTDCYHPLRPRAELYSRFSRDFLAAIDQALAVWGEDRWQKAEDWLAILPAPQPAESTKPIIITPDPQPISAPAPTPPAPAPTPRPAPRPTGTPLSIKLLLAAMLLLLLGGGWFAYHTISAQQAQIEEAQAKAKAEELARQTELLAQQLKDLHPALLAAQPEITPAAERVADGADIADQSTLQQHLASLLPKLTRLKTACDALPQQQVATACDSLPAEPQQLRQKLRAFCLDSSLSAGAITQEDVLSLLGWQEALTTAQDAKAKAKRLQRQEAESIFRCLTAAEYNKKLIYAADHGNAELVRMLLNAGADVNTADEYDITPLWKAANRGHTEVVRLLLAAPGIDINKASTAEWCNGQTPLYRAVLGGNTAVVRLLLATPGIDVEKTLSALQCSMLHLASSAGLTEQVQELIAAGEDVNKADKDGATPLYRAAYSGNTEMVRLLLAAPGIDVNKASTAEWCNGQTPLYWAAYSGHTEVVRLLLAAPGIDVEKTLSVSQWSMLHLAASAGLTEQVQELIAAGEDVNKADKYGQTPLYWAASNGNTEVVKLLLDAGADKDSSSPLTGAAWTVHTEVMKLLLAAGADVNKADKYGQTPLYWAAYSGHTEVMKLLLAAGADVNKADKYGQTPLYQAADSGHTEVMKLLLAAGADVNKATNSGYTPLYRAADNGHTELVRLLLAAPGIDVNKADENGETPLYWAAMRGRTEMVRLLLTDSRIEVNQADKYSNTPLDEALKNGHIEVARLLLADSRIEVNKAEENGWTPLYWAAREGHTEVVRLLLEHPRIDVNKADEDGWTPLYQAVLGGHTEVVRLLLAAPGIDVNKASKVGYTPLDRAVTEEIKRMLRAAGGKTGKELGL